MQFIRDLKLEIICTIIIITGTVISGMVNMLGEYSYLGGVIFILPTMFYLMAKRIRDLRKLSFLFMNVEKFKSHLSGTIEQIYASCTQLGTATESQGAAINQTSFLLP